MAVLLLVKVRNFAVLQYWAQAQNAPFVRKVVENHILFVLKKCLLVASSHFLTTFCTKASCQGESLAAGVGFPRWIVVWLHCVIVGILHWCENRTFSVNSEGV